MKAEEIATALTIISQIVVCIGLPVAAWLILKVLRHERDITRLQTQYETTVSEGIVKRLDKIEEVQEDMRGALQIILLRTNNRGTHEQA